MGRNRGTPSRPKRQVRKKRLSGFQYSPQRIPTNPNGAQSDNKKSKGKDQSSSVECLDLNDQNGSLHLNDQNSSLHLYLTPTQTQSHSQGQAVQNKEDADLPGDVTVLATESNTDDSLIDLLCTANEVSESTPINTGDNSSNFRSLLFEAIVDGDISCIEKETQLEIKLMNAQQQLLQARSQVETLQQGVGRLKREVTDKNVHESLKVDIVNKLNQELSDSKQDNVTQKRQISRYIQDVDNLTKKILSLDAKNVEQRTELVDLYNTVEDLTEKLSIHKVQCQEHQEKIQNLSEKLDDAMYDKALMTAKLESLQQIPQKEVIHAGLNSSWTTQGARPKHTGGRTETPPLPASRTPPVPAPRKKQQVIPQSTQVSQGPKLLIVGNSNAKHMAGRMQRQDIDASAVTYSSATSNFIAKRLPHISQNEKPDAVFLHAADLDVRLNVPVEAVQREMGNLISTAKRTFPQASKFCISSVPLVKDKRLCNRILQVNKYLYSECMKDQKLYFINNDTLELYDQIHLTQSSRDQLARTIAHVVKGTAQQRQWQV